jgi:hypothetical protein
LVVFAPTVVQKGQPHFAWPSRKAVRAAVMVGALLFASLAVNAFIILATARGLIWSCEMA